MYTNNNHDPVETSLETPGESNGLYIGVCHCLVLLVLVIVSPGVPHDNNHIGDGPKTEETTVKGLPIKVDIKTKLGRTTEKTDGMNTKSGEDHHLSPSGKVGK